LNDAIAAYEKSLRFNPGQPLAHHQLGMIYGARGMYDEAVQSYLKAIEQQPDLAEAWNNLGEILRDQGQPNEAMDYFRQAVKFAPEKASFAGNIPYAALFRPMLIQLRFCVYIENGQRSTPIL
jgi:Tfp pilus assembly protein PilF